MRMSNLTVILLSALLILSAAADDFEVVADTISPDGHKALAIRKSTTEQFIPQITFYDIARKAPIGTNLANETVFGIAASAGHDKANRGSSQYKVVWTSTSQRVAVEAGDHQLAAFAIYQLQRHSAAQVSLPDLKPAWAEIRKRIAPFQISKTWLVDPSWFGTDRLRFTMSCSAFKNDGKRESDFLLKNTFSAIFRLNEKGQVIETKISGLSMEGEPWENTFAHEIAAADVQLGDEFQTGYDTDGEAYFYKIEKNGEPIGIFASSYQPESGNEEWSTSQTQGASWHWRKNRQMVAIEESNHRHMGTVILARLTQAAFTPIPLSISEFEELSGKAWDKRRLFFGGWLPDQRAKIILAGKAFSNGAIEEAAVEFTVDLQGTPKIADVHSTGYKPTPTTAPTVSR
ncbi:MAG: hypothetical protein ACI9R3_005622 [Verrucomicrobiales bacterium]|jgi:hypothetical protein